VLTIFRKELADHFGSTRFLILFCLIFIVALVSSQMVGSNLQQALESESRPGLAGNTRPSELFLLLFTMPGPYFSLVQFIAFFGPLIGIITGFDAINRERSAGTLSKLVAQPIFRDAVINGKFLAGVTTISIMLLGLVMLITGFGLVTLGIVPGVSEVARLIVYLIVSIAYVSFWLGLSILFSIWFRAVATSALAAVALWIVFSFFIGFAADLVANAAAPVENPMDRAQQVRHARVAEAASLASPAVLYSESTSTILNPYRRTNQEWVWGMVGDFERLSMSRFQNPLSLGQSILVVVPYLTLLFGLTLVCFGLSYLTFMRQEIRST
jgi:ABC-2 type transport system permease protein